MTATGSPSPLGAHFDGDGVNFALYSGGAEAVDLCLFDADDNESRRIRLHNTSDGVWHTYIADCQPGQAYGYRVHGRYAPDAGQRYNPNKLLLDPYARQLRGSLIWSPAVFDFDPDMSGKELNFNDADSAAFVPKGVVTGTGRSASRHRVPWSESIIYEANVRGYTMRHPAIPDADRGTFRGMRNAAILAYLKALGISSIELMPVHAFIDEQFLHRRGQRNFWGYNSLCFFAPAQRYAGSDPIGEFQEMVDAIHDAGLEVILDVVYNHTGESDMRGPSLSFRGIDNLTYYRTEPDHPGNYINATGCGNTLNVDHPVVRAMIVDSLKYWSEQMGVDGFRFDLAVALGRSDDGFSSEHAMFRCIREDETLQTVKLIAEPWDLGHDGYQSGNFPPDWSEANGKFRDTVRQYWRGDAGHAGQLAQRLHGSADLFEHNGRGPAASINMITCHDGFTLADVVSYASRHNEANGEQNHDGAEQNFSSNCGIEGQTDDMAINNLRRRQRLNMLATLLLSQGTPMLLAGDEIGNSQGGNNNAYAQDNEVGWLDWTGLHADPVFLNDVRQLVQLRKATSLPRQSTYVHGQRKNAWGWRDIEWLDPGGAELEPQNWQSSRSKTLLLVEVSESVLPRHHVSALAILLNASVQTVDYRLPAVPDAGQWELAFTSSASPPRRLDEQSWQLEDRSIACLWIRNVTTRK